MNKLHIGCGKNIIPDWKNLDIQYFFGVDIIDDVTKLTKIEDDSCDIIYACHILEHISRHDTLKVLTLWRNKLKDKGTLRLSVPDFYKILQRYNQRGEILECVGLVNGGQRNSYDVHLMIFDKKLLSDMLHKAGFSDVKEWDWKSVEHSKYDDYSQAYLPHMDKKNGLHMSLNLEATK